MNCLRVYCADKLIPRAATPRIPQRRYWEDTIRDAVVRPTADHVRCVLIPDLRRFGWRNTTLAALGTDALVIELRSTLIFAILSPRRRHFAVASVSALPLL